MDKNSRRHPRHVERARELRNDAPKVESLLWSRLRGNQTGFKFRRQHGVGDFIADFACISAKLMIEIDGLSHEGRYVEDAAREEILRRNKWRIVRFTDDDVVKDLDDVVAKIVRFLTFDPLT